MKVLVTGGAGYIGFITVQELLKQNHQVTIFDHFQTHSPQKIKPTPYIKGDITHYQEIKSALATVKPDAVIHFAAYIQMGESVQNPQKYYRNNVLGSFNLANAMVETGVDKIVFSSSAGVYGNPERIPIQEDDRKQPTNPYGETKLAVERLLRWYEKPYGLRSISIRYFNAAGATLDGSLGEDHQPESHLIPNIIKSQIEGREFTLFGDDYPTKDGTCVRDYIHVVDLAAAHIAALEQLQAGAPSNYYNAGTGHGYSNKQIIDMVEQVTGKPVKVKVLPRRPGDADILVADTTKIKKELGWQPKYSDLETIIKTAYLWHKQQH
ncbi:MAG: UDP-glucose 4-epimerase GalE [Bacteroidetes bacterium]|nr:MAG: UDP-glucose 4-epimerase GalE [Bacteroidota bacterium]